MSVDAKTVKVLREKTGAGMMDCKRALLETNGDLVKAVEELRKAGVAKAEKKGSRAAQEDYKKSDKKAITLKDVEKIGRASCRERV